MGFDGLISCAAFLQQFKRWIYCEFNFLKKIFIFCQSGRRAPMNSMLVMNDKISILTIACVMNERQLCIGDREQRKKKIWNKNYPVCLLRERYQNWSNSLFKKKHEKPKNKKKTPKNTTTPPQKKPNKNKKHKTKQSKISFKVLKM